MDEDRLSLLALQHLVDGLRLALGALDLLEAPQDITLHQLQDLESVRQRLEVSTVTLLLQAGVSWETMAEQLGVRRQSLHRRLFRKSLAFLDRSKGSRSDLDREWKRLVTEWTRLLGLIDEKVDVLNRTLPGDASTRVVHTLLK